MAHKKLVIRQTLCTAAAVWVWALSTKFAKKCPWTIKQWGYLIINVSICTKLDIDYLHDITSLISIIQLIIHTSISSISYFLTSMINFINYFRDAQVCSWLVSSSGLPEAGISHSWWSCSCGYWCGDSWHSLHQWQGVLHHHVHVLQCPVAGE